MFSTFEEGLTLDRIDNSKGYFKDNCRWVTQTIQSRNTRRIIVNNTSGYKGVSFNKLANKYSAQIIIQGKKIHLGYFDTALEASLHYDSYIITNKLEHTLNFESSLLT